MPLKEGTSDPPGFFNLFGLIYSLYPWHVWYVPRTWHSIVVFSEYIPTSSTSILFIDSLCVLPISIAIYKPLFNVWVKYTLLLLCLSDQSQCKGKTIYSVGFLPIKKWCSQPVPVSIPYKYNVFRQSLHHPHLSLSWHSFIVKKSFDKCWTALSSLP